MMLKIKATIGNNLQLVSRTGGSEVVPVNCPTEVDQDSHQGRPDGISSHLRDPPSGRNSRQIHQSTKVRG